MAPPDEILWARWDEVDAILAAALERPAEERAAHVAAATVGDAELRDVVLRLVERLATDSGRVTAPSGSVVAEAFGDVSRASRESDLAPGDAVGRWVIVRRRARGGMATVYEAERADGAYQQRVALKVLRRGLDTEDLVRRFLTERQILSSLTHPNIARLLDGGSTPEGRPYLVIELIEGEPITGYADARRLDVNTRLRLFLQVADAVHAAHRQLVVHRDIKPSNILVDGDGNAKLLDFGIAKLLDSDAEHTHAGSRAMTPDYASPEQLRGGAVTTATDVYQLGLLLRELLTGIRPLANAGNAEVPVRPSRLADRALRGTPAPAERAAARDTTTGRLALRLAGDLDVIVAKALRPEPEQRYASADELASDVRRHLRGLPIVAHPESRAYRLRKFVRRNPWGAAAAVGAVVALAGYALTITAQSRRLAEERDRAELEALKSEQVTEFLVQLFRSADPNETRGAQVTARELLDRGARQIEDELGGEPAVRAAMLAAIGRSYRQVGLYDEARQMLERAVAERRAAHGRVHRAVAADLSLLAPMVARSDRTQALQLFQEALEIAEQTLGPGAALVGRILTDYSETLSRVPGSDSRVAEMRERAVAILRSADGDNRADLAHALTVAAYGRGPEVAIPLMTEGLALRRALHGELHTATAGSLSDLALATEAVDPMAADSLMQRALGILERLHGRRHATTLAIMNNLAGLRRDRGAYAEAAPLYREVLALRRELYPDEHGGHAYALYGLGLTLAESANPREGEACLREALAILQRVESPGSILLPLTRAALGYSLVRQRRYDEGEPLLVEGYREISRSASSRMTRERTLERVVRMYREWGRTDAALRYAARLDSLRSFQRNAPGTP